MLKDTDALIGQMRAMAVTIDIMAKQTRNPFTRRYLRIAEGLLLQAQGNMEYARELLAKKK